MSDEIEVVSEKGEREYIGTCKFCGQRMYVKGPFGSNPTQEQIDKIATDECVCDEAVAYRLMEQKCRIMKDNIDHLHINSRWIHDVLCEAIQPIADNGLSKVSITDGSGTTFQLTCGKAGPRLVVKGTLTTITSAAGTEEIEPEDWRHESDDD